MNIEEIQERYRQDGSVERERFQGEIRERLETVFQAFPLVDTLEVHIEIPVGCDGEIYLGDIEFSYGVDHLCLLEDFDGRNHSYWADEVFGVCAILAYRVNGLGKIKTSDPRHKGKWGEALIQAGSAEIFSTERRQQILEACQILSAMEEDILFAFSPVQGMEPVYLRWVR